MLRILPNENNAHLMSVYKDDAGRLVFYDALSGNYYNKDILQKSSYNVEYRGTKHPYKPSILRTDNKILNVSQINKIAKAHKNN